jgi:drug/metabolite transporter, DME family
LAKSHYVSCGSIDRIVGCGIDWSIGVNMERWRGHGLVVMAAIIWSLTSPGLAYLLNAGAHPLALAFWRDVIIAFVALGGLYVFRPNALKVDRQTLAGLAITGAISIGLYHALWVWSIALNGAAIAIVLTYLFPTFVSIGGWLVYGDRVRWPHMIALIVSLIGCALLVRMYDPGVFQLNWLGALIGVLTALTHTVYVLYSQRSVLSINPLASLSYTMLFGAITLLVILAGAMIWGNVQGDLVPWRVFSIGEGWLGWLILAGLALGPTLGGYGIFTAALRYMPARVASLIVVIEAPISTLIAVWFLGERLEPLQVVGMACILGAIGLPALLERLTALAVGEVPQVEVGG